MRKLQKGDDMIKVKDVVFVQTKGICEVLDITKNAFDGCDKNKEYYVMSPVNSANNMKIYFPTDTKVNIRKLTSKTKTEEVFKNFKNLENVEVSSGEDQGEVFNQISQNGELKDRARLLKTLLLKKSKLAKKQWGFQDQRLINLMLNCVVSEVSYVLSLDSDAVKHQIFSELQVAEEN